jgi:hypothetical protein
MSPFLYLPTLAVCLAVICGSAWLGYLIAIQAFDNRVRGAAPVMRGRSRQCRCLDCRDVA